MQGFREMVFEGSLPVVRAFLAGLQEGRRWKSGIYFCEACGVAAETRGHKVLERLHLEKNHTHVLVMDRLAETITEATRNQRKQTGLVLRADRRVRGAGFEYEYKVFKRAAGKRVQKIMMDLPKGLELLDAIEKEVINPEARGVEGYAPEHHYELTGRGEVGTIEALPELIAFRDRLLKRDWFTTGSIRLFTR